MAHGKDGNHGDYRQNHIKHINDMVHGLDGNHGDYCTHDPNKRMVGKEETEKEL